MDRRLKRVDHPSALAVSADEAELFHNRELLRHLYLRNREQFLEVAHAQRTRFQQVQDSQALRVGDAFKDVRSLHVGMTYSTFSIYCQ